MSEDNVKSGKELLNDFFDNITAIENVDEKIARTLSELYKNGKLSDKSIVNELQKLRDEADIKA